MIIRDILNEDSPDTPLGSVTPDLMVSKLWLLQQLVRLNQVEFDNIYILGSWYGALALIIRRLPFKYHQIICCDNDPSKARYLEKLIDRHNFRNIISTDVDCQDLDYAKGNNLVINTSTNDISSDWLAPIIPNTVVAAQGRSNQPSNPVNTLEKFDQSIPLSDTWFLGEKSLIGVDGENYQRFLKIGAK